mmetsp:Transcript_36118/g.109195  ORF Transcript_36118/g.109195 Transcript_36118/m.109195 type:complete len:211 (-) Transcript_36118:394-1026(-)
MRRVREPPDLLHAHGVAGPSVDPLLGQETLLLVHVFWRLRFAFDPRPALIVGLPWAVEDRGDALLGFALLPLDRALLLALPGDLVLPYSDVLLDLLPQGGFVLEAAPLLGRFLGLRVHLFALLRVVAGARRWIDLSLFRGLRQRRRLVPDAPPVLRLGLCADQHLLALIVPGGIGGVPEIVESEVLLVKGQRVHPRLLDVTHLGVVILLL